MRSLRSLGRRYAAPFSSALELRLKVTINQKLVFLGAAYVAAVGSCLLVMVVKGGHSLLALHLAFPGLVYFPIGLGWNLKIPYGYMLGWVIYPLLALAILIAEKPKFLLVLCALYLVLLLANVGGCASKIDKNGRFELILREYDDSNYALESARYAHWDAATRRPSALR